MRPDVRRPLEKGMAGAERELRPQAYATVFCICGWALAGAQGDQLYCENPKCKDAGKIFRLQISLVEIEAHNDGKRLATEASN